MIEKTRIMLTFCIESAISLCKLNVSVVQYEKVNCVYNVHSTYFVQLQETDKLIPRNRQADSAKQTSGFCETDKRILRNKQADSAKQTS